MESVFPETARMSRSCKASFSAASALLESGGATWAGSVPRSGRMMSFAPSVCAWWEDRISLSPRAPRT
eukprot:scaffold13_cov241-Pinguiococcus_pyrenoidosus.AAC.36